MNEDLITDDLTVGEITGSDDTNDGMAAQSGVSIKDVLGQTLGKQFTSDEAALKAVKDTFSYVGKKIDPQQAGQAAGQTSANKEADKLDTSKFISREQYEQDMFYSKNPQLEEYKDILSGLAVANNVSVSEASNLESFKKMFEKTSAYDSSQKAKSVLETNPRLGHVTDKLSKAREFVAQGNSVAAADNAVAAVIDAYNLK
jgi:hypothetical protein